MDRLKSSPEPLVKLREIPSVSQNRLDKGFEENPFRESRPTGAMNDFDELRVVLIARKIGDCLFHFAESPLETLNSNTKSGSVIEDSIVLDNCVVGRRCKLLSIIGQTKRPLRGGPRSCGLLDTQIIPVECALMTRQELTALLHDANHGILHSPQSLYDGLRLPPYKVAERYLGNELAVTLEISYEIGGRAERILAQVRPVTLHHVEGKFKGSGGGDDYQCTVLVHNVEFVNGKQNGIGGLKSAIWLNSLDEAENAGVCDSLYFSFVLGEHVRRRWPVLQDWKVNPSHMLLPVFDVREVPNDMVQARSQMVNDLARKHTEPERDRALTVVLDCLGNNLLVIIAEERVVAFLKEPGDFGLKVLDVLVGPI